MRKKIPIAFFVALSFKAVWQFVLVPRWKERIPAGWQCQTNYAGYQTWPDPQPGQMQKKDTLLWAPHASEKAQRN